jgi:hypothetical protein
MKADCTCYDSDTRIGTIEFEEGEEPDNYCIGGTVSNERINTAQSSRENYVICNNDLESNYFQTDIEGTGGWGGTCKCPDGNEYIVSDENNTAFSLKCYGGMPKPFAENPAEYILAEGTIFSDNNLKHSGVVCAPVNTIYPNFEEGPEENSYNFPHYNSRIRLKNLPGGNEEPINTTCMCPDGNNFDITGEYSEITDYCIGGHLGDLSSVTTPLPTFNGSSKELYKVICNSKNNYYSKNNESLYNESQSEIGKCKCSDGEEYFVKNNKSGIKRLNCIGGVPIDFNDGSVVKDIDDISNEYPNFDQNNVKNYLVCGNRSAEFETNVCN